MRWRTLLVGICCVSVSAVTLTAHHALHTVYDEGEAMTIEGTIGRIVNRNPHPLVDLVVTSRGGLVRTWAVEFEAVSQLSDAAHRVVLRPGDRILVCGNPGRDPGQYRLRMLQATRHSDGWSVQQPKARQLGRHLCLGR